MYKTALVLTAVGALNWGLIALFELNLVALFFGVDTILTNVIYLIVAAAAIYALVVGFSTSTRTSDHTHTARREHRNEPAFSNR